jgi:type III secretion protein N (ATPase)
MNKQILDSWFSQIDQINPCRRSGKLEVAVGTTLLASLPGARIGERVFIGKKRVKADVTGFKKDQVVLLPTGSVFDLSPGMDVIPSGQAFQVPWTGRMLGKVLDANAEPIDRATVLKEEIKMPLDAPAPSPLCRRPIDKQLTTGVRAIDGLCSIGSGQRLGLFAGPGLGKSTLLGQIAKNTKADCVVLCLVGERGRELGEFVKDDLGEDGLKRSVVVCATSDAPAGERARALPVATTIAEGFRKQGLSVLLLVDSLTRHARALREIALASGETPGRRGFPPSVFDNLAKLVERTGNDDKGSITAIYTVLMDGEQEEDPVAQETKGLLDGHIFLDKHLAESGCFPAVDPCASLSRLMPKVVQPNHLEQARQVVSLWSAFESRRDLIAAGAYQPGSEPKTDLAIAKREQIMDFIRQKPDQKSDLEQTLSDLSNIIGDL